MKIVNNMVEPTEKPLEIGDVIVGNFTKNHYIIVYVDGVKRALSLRTLATVTLGGMDYTRTNIKQENITITFEGAN